ncbi:hypothetical protein PYW07_010095 [Mythimna separata]|uniref:snRNA-activating protein complex subunit 4 n=1 Tax=Mythimna separata TaxID=271217 RepID=A0AAD7YI09_MYTSE|nr:hypothetical protein PYW07_010095 [Mythimna separata]
MNIDDLEFDSETDSEIDSDDDPPLLEPDQLKRLNALVEDEDLHSERMPRTHSSLTTTTQQTSASTIDSQLAALDAEIAADEAEIAAAEDRIIFAVSTNKLLEEKISKLEGVLPPRLSELREKLAAVQIRDSVQNDKNDTFRYINCGRPYFKDRQNFPAPDNDDAKMAKSQMYDFSLVISAPGWTVKDKSELITMIHKMSIDIRKNELHSKIANLKRNTPPSTKLDKEIMAIRKEIDKVSKLPLSKVALPIDQEYDWDMLTNKLNRRHTAQEYQALWKLFFHPSISKNSWSTAEHARLLQIACANRKQDWDSIALQLNTGRTGYQCFVYFRTNMNNSFTGKKWTNEEVTYLKRLIEYFKEDFYIPWGKIAAAMENRTKIQIYNKYMRLIELRKGRFLPEEDAVILNCVERFGTNFKRMVDYLPGRSMVQIRARYQVLSKMRVSTVWTVEDDKKLIQLMRNQESTMNFSTATQYFPGRNRTKIRTRYVTLMKWLKKHPNLGVEHAPRRGARRLNHGRPSENLNDAVENLKNSLITTVETKAKRKKINYESTHVDLDDAIFVYLVNCIVKEIEAESKKSAPENLVVLGPDLIVSISDWHITNLRKNIIFLNACLDEERYFDSNYKIDYPSVGDNSQDVSLVRVKSYSRKKSSLTIMVRDSPNVWGRPQLFEGTRTMAQRTYVIPPQLATITGIKAILECVMDYGQYSESINLHVLCRRNSLLKEQLDQVLERFYVLFTWAMILSNEGPNIISKTPRIDSVFVRPPTLPTAPEVTINVKCIKKFKNKQVTESIDLNESDAKKTVIAVEDDIEASDNKISNLFSD